MGAVITGLPGILSRRIDPRSGTVMAWGAAHAGNAPNAIPQEGMLRGTVRTGEHGTWADMEPLVRSVIGEILAPLGFADGRLFGYVTFECQLEVTEGTGEDVGARLPLLLNAVNMRTYRAPLASGPDGLVPSLGAFRRVVMEAAAEVYGKDVVRSVAVTRAAPA